MATINQQMGVLGGFSDVIERVSGRSRALGWKAYFLVGIVAGGVLFALLADVSAPADGYGWLTRTFGEGSAVVGALLLGSGVLIGFGAKTAGGCTSGNGISGTSFGSPSSFVAMGTFMVTAIGASFLIEGLI